VEAHGLVVTPLSLRRERRRSKGGSTTPCALGMG